MLVLTSLKWLPLREWRNWYKAGWMYCLKSAQRPGAKEKQSSENQVCFVTTGGHARVLLGTAADCTQTCFSFHYLYLIFKWSAFCCFCSFEREAYFLLKIANKLQDSFNEAAWFSENHEGLCVTPPLVNRRPTRSRERSSPLAVSSHSQC